MTKASRDGGVRRAGALESGDRSGNGAREEGHRLGDGWVMRECGSGAVAASERRRARLSLLRCSFSISRTSEDFMVRAS